jgi:hypothetical protein
MQTKRMGARPVYNNDSNNTQFTYASKCVCVCVAPAVGANKTECSRYGGFFLVPATVCKCLDGVRHAIRRYVTLGNCPDVWLVFSYMYAGLLVERENRQQTDRERKKASGQDVPRCSSLTFFLFFSLLPHGVQYGSFVISAR